MPMVPVPVRSAGSVGLCIRLRCDVPAVLTPAGQYDDTVTDHDTAKADP